MGAVAASLKVIVSADIGGALSGLAKVSATLSALGKGAAGGLAAVDHFFGALRGVGAFLGGIPDLVQGAFGVGLAVELENVQALLQGVTHDAGLTASILADMRTEADVTPFGFAELATAAAQLLPIASASNVALMDIVRTAELLAATNPGEGLKGAAFSIREALSGDFVSLQERFNLPRGTINELKKLGLAPMAIINRALASQGFDRSLIDQMAGTFQGRLSTFTDALDSIRIEAGTPILASLTAELERWTGVVGTSSGTLKTWAAQMGGVVASGIHAAGEELATVLVTAQNIAAAHGLSLPESLSVATELRIGEVFGPDAAGAFHGVVDAIKGLPATLGTIAAFFQTEFPKALETVKTVAAEIQATMRAMVLDIKQSIALMVIDLANAGIWGLSDSLKPAADRLRQELFPPGVPTNLPTTGAGAGAGGDTVANVSVNVAGLLGNGTSDLDRLAGVVVDAVSTALAAARTKSPTPAPALAGAG